MAVIGEIFSVLSDRGGILVLSGRVCAGYSNYEYYLSIILHYSYTVILSIYLNV